MLSMDGYRKLPSLFFAIYSFPSTEFIYFMNWTFGFSRVQREWLHKYDRAALKTSSINDDVVVFIS
jgi:hypothetical protein